MVVSFPSEGVVETKLSDRWSPPGRIGPPFELIEWVSGSSAMIGGFDTAAVLSPVRCRRKARRKGWGIIRRQSIIPRLFERLGEWPFEAQRL
jgi:hypothetical protein